MIRIIRTGPRGLGNPTSDFAALLATVRDAGLLRRHRRFYVINFLVVSIVMAGAWVGFAALREPELLPGYVEFLRRLPGALRQRRIIQARRRVDRVPFGLLPPPGGPRTPRAAAPRGDG